MQVIINGTVYDLSNTQLILEDESGKVFYSPTSKRLIIVPNNNYPPCFSTVEEIKAKLIDGDKIRIALENAGLIEKQIKEINMDNLKMVTKAFKYGLFYVKCAQVVVDTTASILEDKVIAESCTNLITRVQELAMAKLPVIQELEKEYNKMRGIKCPHCRTIIKSEIPTRQHQEEGMEHTIDIGTCPYCKEEFAIE